MRHSKRYFIFVSVILSLVLTTVSHAYMEHDDITQRWGVGASFATSLSTSDETNPAFSIGVNATYGIKDNIAVTLDVGYHEFGYEALGLNFGELEAVPLIFSLQWRYPFMMSQIPATVYGITGLGAIFYDFDNEGSTGARNVDVDDAFAVRLGAGMDFFMDYNWVLNVEGSYTFSDTNVILSNTDGSQMISEDTDYWLLGGGVKYFF